MESVGNLCGTSNHKNSPEEINLLQLHISRAFWIYGFNTF